MNKIVFLDDVIDALVEKGQKSKRYKLGEKWELTGVEIREALDTVPIIDLKVMIRPQEETAPTDPREMASEFTSCCDCVHVADSAEICILRGCVHAIVQKECFRKRQDERRQRCGD